MCERLLSIDEINSLENENQNLKKELNILNKQYSSLLKRYKESLLIHKRICEKIRKVIDEG